MGGATAHRGVWARRGYNAIYAVGLLYTKEMLIAFLAEFCFPVS